MDHLPLAQRPSRPRPHRRTLTLLVGRITTIKLAFWAAVTVVELALPAVLHAPIEARLPVSAALVALLAAGSVAWAVRAARAIDRRLGALDRSLPAIATAFIAASAVATPASIPLLLLERQRSLEGCAPAVTCHYAPVLLWVAVLVAGTVLIPLAFAAALPGRGSGDHGGQAPHSP